MCGLGNLNIGIAYLSRKARPTKIQKFNIADAHRLPAPEQNIDIYVENPVVDPKAPPAKPAAAPAKTDEAKPAETKPDALTDALMAIENKAWEAWKTRDKAGIESVMAKDFMYVSGLGRMTKADATKEWGDKKCEGLDFKLTDPMGISLGSDVALVTYKADAKGSCDGKPVTPAFWVASFDIKEGDAWKNALYTDVTR